jgi:hypothetical protein
MADLLPQSNAELKSIDAVNAATEHAAAVEEARKSQVEEALLLAREETKNVFVHAMREVLTTGDEGTKALLIQKIPLLCVDILKIKGDLFWIKWLLMGLVGGIGVLTISLLTNLHN